MKISIEIAENIFLQLDTEKALENGADAIAIAKMYIDGEISIAAIWDEIYGAEIVNLAPKKNSPKDKKTTGDLFDAD